MSSFLGSFGKCPAFEHVNLSYVLLFYIEKSVVALSNEMAILTTLGYNLSYLLSYLTHGIG